MILTLPQALDLIAQKDSLIFEITAQKDSQIGELTRKLESTQRQLATLQHQMEQMLRRLYGRKSEQLNPNQMMLDSIILESLEQNAPRMPFAADVPVQPEVVKTRKASQHHGRVPIPEHLERVEILLDIPEEQKVCPETGESLKVISVEVSEKLEYRPGKLIVNVYKRPQYALPERADSFAGVIAATMPEHPIAKCKADVGLIAHLIVSKFADHLPLYRQDGIFEREGVTIPRATQSSWLMQVYESAYRLEEVFRRAVLESDIVFTDDAPVPLQVKGNGKLKKARLWVCVRGGPGPPLTAYDFSIDRSKRRPLDFFKDYQGYVHADAYSGYDELFKKKGIIEVGCWAHARRKFDEAASSRPKEATDILARIARLYHEVETPCAGMEPEERRRFRQEHAAPLLAGIFAKIEEMRRQTTPSEPLRKAIDYALNQRKALCRYLEDGRLRPDNNLAENAMRPVALGRKNWLFVGSERGGRAAALFMGLVQSCKDCEINPWEYFDDMLRRIMSHPVTRLRELLPDQWKPLPKDERGLLLSAKA
ncbi:IS66 family transposase [Brevundimonas sp.]|uniref:IS66 family transposase n=1 Tax=Brevundimonas sp. TaxID=1871086 RepID=UPI00273182FA|nr:IS66 family transposase [Brevundimonas sp.]MDP1912055.1 IS66 family transposase [Brevundimonas sp.]